MSYIYTLKSKYLNALNDVIKKVTITENAKVLKNPLLEADNNFTSIIQSENKFDPSKINSNVLADETDNQEDEKKIEKKNKLKTMVLNKIKQSLEISDDLQAILKEIDDINKDEKLNEWILNEKGNTAELKAKNAAIFKQNDQLCLSHDGKIEIFHSVPELHEWLKKNNYPLPKNIKLHESVQNLQEKKNNTNDDDFFNQWLNNKVGSKIQSKPEINQDIEKKSTKTGTLADIYNTLVSFYGKGLATILTLRQDHSKKPVSHGVTSKGDTRTSVSPEDAKILTGYEQDKREFNLLKNKYNTGEIKIKDATGMDMSIPDINDEIKHLNHILRIDSSNAPDKIYLKSNEISFLKEELAEQNNEIEITGKFYKDDKGKIYFKLTKDCFNNIHNYINKQNEIIKNTFKNLENDFKKKHELYYQTVDKYKGTDANLTPYGVINPTTGHVPMEYSGQFDNLDVTLELPDLDYLETHTGKEGLDLTPPQPRPFPYKIGANSFGKEYTRLNNLYNSDMGKPDKSVKAPEDDLSNFITSINTNSKKRGKLTDSIDEDCATGVSNLGPAVQYTGDKELDEADTLEETVLIATGPNGEKDYKYTGITKDGQFTNNPYEGKAVLRNKKAVVTYWLTRLNEIDNAVKEHNLTPEQQNLYNVLSSSGMMDKTDPNSFISKLWQMSKDNFMVDHGNYQYNYKNAKLGKNRSSLSSKTMDVNGVMQGEKWNDIYTIVPDLYHDYNTKDDKNLIFQYKNAKGDKNKLPTIKNSEELQAKVKELKDRLDIVMPSKEELLRLQYATAKNIDDVYDNMQNAEYSTEDMFKWFLLPECIRGDDKKIKLWLDGLIYVSADGSKEVDADTPGAYSYNTLRYCTDTEEEGMLTNELLPTFKKFLYQFRQALIDDCYSKTSDNKRIENIYNKLNNTIQRKVKDEIDKNSVKVEKNKTMSELEKEFVNILKDRQDPKRFIYEKLMKFLYTSKTDTDLKISFLQKLILDSNMYDSNLEVTHKLESLCKEFQYINSKKVEDTNVTYNLELLKQDLNNTFNEASNNEYNLELLKKDLQSNLQTLTEDESPADFASIDITNDLNNDTDGASDVSTDTQETSDINLDTPDDNGVNPSEGGDSFGNINIGNMGEYGPDNGEDQQPQIPAEPEKIERIIDVLENENGDLEVKVQDEDTKKVTTKKLYEIDV